MGISRLPGGKAAVPIRSEFDPNDDAPASGRYELLNVFGTGTGETAYADEGERLPAAPLGYRWRLVAVDEPLEAARRRILEAEKRVARQQSLIQLMEQRGHAEIAKLGLTLLHALQASLQAARRYVERLEELPR
jgi:hypothetical protein